MAKKEPESTAMVEFEIPEDVRKDLLKAQQQEITTVGSLPKVRIMAAGAGLYEFDAPGEGERGETVSQFYGVILGSHSRNVLWDHEFNPHEVVKDEDKFPACSSVDGKWGTPREGFLHESLGGRIADGTERIECKTCYYNQWNTGNALIAKKNPKGKAVTNQRSLYIMIEGNSVPVELVLPPTSLTAYDDYSRGLLNRGEPVQGIITEFTQYVKSSGKLKWGEARFRNAGKLTESAFRDITQKMREYQSNITPPEYIPTATVEDVQVPNAPAVKDDEQDDLPF